MSFSDDPFPSGWEIATSNYLVSNESNGEDVFESLDLDLGPGGEKVIEIKMGVYIIRKVGPLAINFSLINSHSLLMWLTLRKTKVKDYGWNFILPYGNHNLRSQIFIGHLYLIEWLIDFLLLI